jgi:hypothetical protein
MAAAASSKDRVREGYVMSLPLIRSAAGFALVAALAAGCGTATAVHPAAVKPKHAAVARTATPTPASSPSKRHATHRPAATQQVTPVAPPTTQAPAPPPPPPPSQMPGNGDNDADNNGGPSDGDGSI